MARTKGSLGLNGNTFKILSVFFCYYLLKRPLRMQNFYRWGRGPVKGLGYNALSKAFTYLRNHKLIQHSRGYGNHMISDEGIKVLTETLLKRQKCGLTCEINGICLEVDSNTRQISHKTSLDKGTNPGQVVQITS